MAVVQVLNFGCIGKRKKSFSQTYRPNSKTQGNIRKRENSSKVYSNNTPKTTRKTVAVGQKAEIHGIGKEEDQMLQVTNIPYKGTYPSSPFTYIKRMNEQKERINSEGTMVTLPSSLLGTRGLV